MKCYSLHLSLSDTYFLFRYFKGEDPAGWVSVDPKTGEITTANNLDRESPYVKNNVYTVIIYSVENGERINI